MECTAGQAVNLGGTAMISSLLGWDFFSSKKILKEGDKLC